MNELLKFMGNLFVVFLYLGGIVAIAAAARFLWITARFTYVIKLQKYNKDKMEAEREYNVISAENSQLMIANENIRQAYADFVVNLKDAERKLNDINKKIEIRSEELLKLENNEEVESKEKRGPGRPRKQK